MSVPEPEHQHHERIVKAVVFVPELGARIEGGKVVDLAVLDRDIPGPEMGPLGDTRVHLTVVEGAAVHEDPSLERR
jgi:hypothetical protein